MLNYTESQSLTHLNSGIPSDFFEIRESGFFVTSKSEWKAYPFEAANHFLDEDITRLRALFKVENHSIFGGVFNEEYNFYAHFACLANEIDLTDLSVIFSNCKLYFYDTSFTWLFFFSGIEYGILFSNKELSLQFFQHEQETVFEKFQIFTENWSRDWNMEFLNVVLNNCIEFNSQEKTECNFLPQKYIRLDAIANELDTQL